MTYLAEHWLSFILTLVLIIILIFNLVTKTSISKWDSVYKARALLVLVIMLLVIYNGFSYHNTSSLKQQPANDTYNSIK